VKNGSEFNNLFSSFSIWFLYVVRTCWSLLWWWYVYFK